MVGCWRRPFLKSRLYCISMICINLIVVPVNPVWQHFLVSVLRLKSQRLSNWVFTWKWTVLSLYILKLRLKPCSCTKYVENKSQINEARTFSIIAYETRGFLSSKDRQRKSFSILSIIQVVHYFLLRPIHPSIMYSILAYGLEKNFSQRAF